MRAKSPHCLTSCARSSCLSSSSSPAPSLPASPARPHKRLKQPAATTVGSDSYSSLMTSCQACHGDWYAGRRVYVTEGVAQISLSEICRGHTSQVGKEKSRDGCAKGVKFRKFCRTSYCILVFFSCLPVVQTPEFSASEDRIGRKLGCSDRFGVLECSPM